MCVSVCDYVDMSVRDYVCMSVCVYVCEYLSECMCMCFMHIIVYLGIYACVCVLCMQDVYTSMECHWFCDTSVGKDTCRSDSKQE